MPILRLAAGFILCAILAASAEQLTGADEGQCARPGQSEGPCAALLGEDVARQIQQGSHLLQTRADVVRSFRAPEQVAGRQSIAAPDGVSPDEIAPADLGLEAEPAATGSLVLKGLLAFFAVICLCCGCGCAGRSHWPSWSGPQGSADRALTRSSESAWPRKLATQVWALSWKNKNVTSRTEVPCCTCCNTACLMVMAPLLYVALLTALPKALVRISNSPDMVVVHPKEYGRNYSNPAVWTARDRNLHDYLFQAPRIEDMTPSPGSAPLWAPVGKPLPGGACYCRTLGVVGTAGPDLQGYLERRYGEWQADWRRRSGIANPMDTVLQEQACPANNKKTLFRTFDTEEELEEWVQDFDYGSVNRTRGTSGAKDRLCGAVVFRGDPRTDRIPRVVVRTNVTGMGVSGVTGVLSAKKVNREEQGVAEQSAAFYWYLRSGFLGIQDLVDDFLLETRSVNSTARSKAIDFVPLPTEPFSKDVFAESLAGALTTPGTATILFAALVMNVSSFMIRERNARQKELMRLMGLYDSSLAFSWLVLFACVNLATAFCCTFTIYSTVVVRSDPVLLVLLIFFCGMATTAFGMIISTLISTERLGALVAISCYQIMGLSFLGLTVSDNSAGGPQGFGSDISDAVSSQKMYMFCVIPQVAFTLCLRNYLKMDLTNQGCTLKTMFTAVDRFAFAGGLLMLVFDFFMYAAIFAYLEQVMQHDVGLARPWYFPLQPSFWSQVLGIQIEEDGGATDDHVQDNTMEVSGELFEDENSEAQRQLRSKNLVVSVRNLRKDFKNASGMTIRAVDGLDLTMYQGECFCLLGHNGAGKSTTMAILTGMLPQTSGDVHVLGHKLPERRDIVRSQMGFCMQQNVLWDTLTVEEHIGLFGALIGMSPEATSASCDEVLQLVELTSKRQTDASALSGGMKRKLNVALALLGNSRILFLDEPTAGMDPHTRRQLWEVLKQTRAERIMCLTTHYMDEADELGDRTCIMVSGRAACSGTNQFLKHQLGCGYVLNFVKTAESVNDGAVVALAKRHCGDGVGGATEVGRELRLRVPFAGAAGFPGLMRELDRDLAALGLESYGVGVSDLEDVFLKVASGHAVSSTNRADARPDATSVAAKAASEIHEPGFWTQFIGLLSRRIQYGRRDSRMFFCQLVMPVLIMVLFLSISEFAMNANLSLEYPEVAMDTAGWSGTDDAFGPTLVSVAVTDGGAEETQLADAWLRKPPRGVTQVAFEDSLSVESYRPPPLSSGRSEERQRSARLVNEVAFADYAYNVSQHQGAITPQFGGVLYSKDRVTIFPNASAQYSASAMLSLHFSAIIAAEGRETRRVVGVPPLDGVDISSKPLAATSAEKSIIDAFGGFSMGMIMLSAYSFIPAGIAAFVAMEREVEVKHQMMVSGTGRVAYWMSNLVFDSVFGLFSTIGTLIVFSFFGAPQWLSQPNIQATLVLLALFTPAAAVTSYVYSLLFATAGGALVGVLIVGLVLGSFSLEIAGVLIFFKNTRTYGYILLWLVRALFPAACVGNGLMQLAMSKDLSKHMYLNPFSGFVFGTEYRFDFLGDMPAMYLAGDDIFMLALDTVVYSILLLMLDGYGEVSFTRRLLGARRSSSRCPTGKRQAEDRVVSEERTRVRALDPASQVLVVDDVHKTYDGETFAVRGISYAVAGGQVFGLLGVNGAGKTTTFKMMCGQLESSAGKIWVAGKCVAEDPETVRKHVGYCPQFNALLDLLTVREHLELFGQIKGLAGLDLENDVMSKISTFDLGKFEHSRASQLSGGNMRKLSCALAMVGEPPIIFLDEPSAGMDPVARRFMWDVIQGIARQRKGSAVILTTHSMEEADALCSRIAIQTSGQVRCLGTPQQLKEWYGTGLELNVRLEAPKRAAIENLCLQWGGRPEESREASDLQSFIPPSAVTRFPREVTLGAVAEWRLARDLADQVSAFLREQCGGESCVECVEQTGRSLSFRLTGDCPGGGPLPYGRLFELLEGNRSRLHFADFQLSQGTLERTFNRLAAEDIARNEAASEAS